MRRGILSSSLSPIFSSKKNVAIIIIVIFIIIGGFLCILEFSNPHIKITPLHNEGGHFVHPDGEYWNDYFEYRMFANISGLPENSSGYYCVCSFYSEDSGEILNQSNVSLSRYSSTNPNKDYCGILRWHTYHNISKVEISVFDENGTLLTYETYKWDNNPKLVTNITDSIYSEDF